MAKQTIFLLMEPAEAIPVWFSRIIDGIRKSCVKNRLGLHLLQNIDELDSLPEKPVSVLMICSQNSWIHHVIRELKIRGIMPVLLGSVVNQFGFNISGVMMDRCTFIEKVMEYFLDCGRTKMALVGVNRNASNDNVKADVFLHKMAEYGLPASEADIYYIDTDLLNSVEHCLDRVDQYDSVICSNDYVGVLLAQARKRGIAIPEHLYVVGLGDTLIGHYTQPTLTSTSNTEFLEVGRQAVTLWRIIQENPTLANIQITVGTEIIPRGSTAFSEPADTSRAIPFTPAPQIRIGARSQTVRNLENCLRACDPLDTQILQALLKGQCCEQIESDLFLAHSSLYYRIKKMCQLANVSNRNELEALFSYYLPNFISVAGALPSSSESSKFSDGLRALP